MLLMKYKIEDYTVKYYIKRKDLVTNKYLSGGKWLK